jgi:hypothetical protein
VNASNSVELQWFYDHLAADVDRELHMMAGALRFNTVRMFSHALLWELDGGRTLTTNFDKFLTTAASYGIKASLGPFFDDCHNYSTIPPTGVDDTHDCIVKGWHNGCWFTSPTQAQRTGYSRFEPYVSGMMSRFANDSRVRYVELYNEPHADTATPNWPAGNFSSCKLRDMAREWADGYHSVHPVLACWNDNPDTDAVDSHNYNTDFASWAAILFGSEGKGAVVTEGGSRWYQGQKDYGSPMLMLHFFSSLRISARKFVPGAMLNWESMVGNSNTRWQWSAAHYSAEPTIPWDGWIFPDGTPVSYTEVGLLRAYAVAGTRDNLRGLAFETGFDEDSEFIAWDSFLPQISDSSFIAGDTYLTLSAGEVHTLQAQASTWSGQQPGAAGAAPVIGDGIVEASLWPGVDGIAEIWVRAAAGSDGSPESGVVVSLSSDGTLEARACRSPASCDSLFTFNMSSVDCGVTTDGWNLVRVVMEGDSLSVWANTMLLDVYGSEDPTKQVLTVPGPRANATVPSYVAAAGSAVLSSSAKSGNPIRVDYVSALPLSWEVHKMRGKW